MEKNINLKIDIMSRPALDNNIYGTGEIMRAVRNADTCFIGVVSSREWCSEHPLHGVLNSLIVQFDDVNELMINNETVCISDDDAWSIVNFVKNNKHIDKWIIQCDGGISRSGSIADVLAQFLEKERKDESIYNNFLRKFAYKILPNTIVKDKLLTCFGLKK